MRIMGYSLLWVMQDLDHQPHESLDALEKGTKLKVKSILCGYLDPKPQNLDPKP